MEPAYHIPLSPEALATLGELSAIQGLIDWQLTRIIAELLNLSPDAANRIMGSTAVRANMAIFDAIVAEKMADEAMKTLCARASDHIADISETRNAFIHAYYMTALDGGGRMLGIHKTPATAQEATIAVKTRSGKAKPIAELQPCRDLAAQVSCMLAHVFHGITAGPHVPSPWRDRALQ